MEDKQMDSTGITPVMSVGNDGMNGFMGIFGLLILLGILNGGFGGGLGGGNGNSNAIQNDINRGFDNQNLQAQSRDILGAVSAGTAQSVAASNQVYHDVVNNLSDKYMELARDIAGVQGSVAQAIANQNECCCSTKLLISESTAGLSAQIAQNKYDNALALAGLEQRLTSKMDQNEITSLRDQVQQLQLAQATAGMLRFPNAWTYNGGVFPPVTPATGA
jgi:hypothetical protein